MKKYLKYFPLSRLRHVVVESLIVFIMTAPAVLWAAPSLLLDDGADIAQHAAKDLPSSKLSESSDVLLYSLNPELMQQLWQGETDRLNLPVNGQDITFRQVQKIVRNKNITWEGIDVSGHIKVLLTLGKDHVYGRIVGSFGTFGAFGISTLSSDSAESISAAASGAEEPLSRVGVRQLDPEKEVAFGHDYLVPPQAAGESKQADQAEQAPSDAAAIPEDGSRIDVMVLYTDGMAAAHPGDQINTRIQYLLDLGNESFSNSGINTRFNLVRAQEVIYPDDSPGDMSEALDDLTKNNGVFSGVEELRTRYGADQVVLLRQYVDEGCGLAWINKGYLNDARYAYAVVQDGSRTDGYYCSELSYVHEIGHNLGCAHDRANSSLSGRYDYSYGYQSPAKNFRTVMAYNCPDGGCQRVTYFSNPAVQYQGEATGVLYTAANSADNARTINQTRIEVANYREAVNSGDRHAGSGSLPALLLLLLN